MTIADPSKLESLIARLKTLRPDAERRWGTLDAGEMLCHLADGSDVVLMRRDASEPESEIRPRPFLKWLALYAPFVPWAKGAETDAKVDPRRDGTRPGDFEADRRRVLEGLLAVASASDGELNPVHGLFGPMSRRDWHRSAYRHVDHHLRQFGV